MPPTYLGDATELLLLASVQGTQGTSFDQIAAETAMKLADDLTSLQGELVAPTTANGERPAVFTGEVIDGAGQLVEIGFRVGKEKG